MSETTSTIPENEQTSVPKRTPRWIVIGLAVVFGLLFAFNVWQAIGDLLTMPAIATNAGGSISGFGWTLLVLRVLIPVVAFIVAFLLALKRGVLGLVLSFLAALGTAWALSFSLAVVFLGG